jgi:4-carboxymuconolactone decarboxylase
VLAGLGSTPRRSLEARIASSPPISEINQALTRIPFPDPPSPQVAKVLGRLPDLAIFRMLGHAEAAFIPWLRFGNALLDPAGFDPRLRELAILRVATLTPGAEYEWAQHVAIARELGASDEHIALLRTARVEAFDGDERLVLDLTDQVVSSAQPDDATLRAFIERFSPAELVHLLLVIGQYMMLGRVMATAALQPEPAAGLAAIRG